MRWPPLDRLADFPEKASADPLTVLLISITKHTELFPHRCDVTIDRREFVAGGIAGLGIAGFGGAAHAGNGAEAAVAAATPEAAVEAANSTSAGSVASTEPVAPDPRLAQFASLLAPVGAGTVVGVATVSKIDFDDWGRGTADLELTDGSTMQVDVCAKDDSLSHEAVASTERYQLFLRNGADGRRATDEEIALVVGGLADAIRDNEASTPVAVLTKSEYWARGC